MSETAVAVDPVREVVAETASAIMRALREDELDVASCELESLRSLVGRSSDDADILLFRVVIAIQRGQAREALLYLNDLGEDCHPALRVLCLYSLQDPYWEGLARELADSSQSDVAAAMVEMLDCQSAARHNSPH
jgi:hypothetical protein